MPFKTLKLKRILTLFLVMLYFGSKVKHGFLWYDMKNPNGTENYIMKKIGDVCEESELREASGNCNFFFLSYMPHFLYFELNNQWTFNKDLLYHQSLSMMYSRRDTISKTLKYSSSHTCQGSHRDNRQQLIHFLSFFWSCFIPIFQQFLRVHRPFEKKHIFRSSNEMYVTFLLEKLMH